MEQEIIESQNDVDSHEIDDQEGVGVNDEGDLRQDDEGENQADTEEFEEIEFSGKKYHVPKELKNAFLMQSDYTRKTQEVAEQRKAVEAQQAAFQQQAEAQQQQIKLVARINNLDEQIAEFAKADWNELAAHDPVKAQQLFMHYSTLKDQRTAAEQEYHETNSKLNYERSTALQQKLADEQAVLQRDIKDWSPAKAQALSEFAVNKLGFHPNDVAQVYDAKIVKLLNMAYMADQMISKQNGATKQAPAIKETPTVSTKAASSGTKDPSKMSDREFAQWRRSQIKSRGV